MASTRQLATFALLTAIVSLVIPVAHAEGLSRRTELLPYLDYAGIEAASEDSLASEVVRRSLAGSSAAYDDIVARAENEARSGTPRCRTISKRLEWRQLTRAQQKDYIRATKCLQTKGDYGISPISDTLYDAFVAVHQTKWPDFHGNAPFMPWHRWFVWLHHESIKKLCGYAGPMPYWDYSLDSQDPFASPIFSTDPEIGFGTHGTEVLNEIGQGGFKVDNGAFANLKLTIPEPHFLTRNFSAWMDIDPTGQWGKGLGGAYSPAQIAIGMQKNTFYDFTIFVDGHNVTNLISIHNAPHFASMGDWNGPRWLLGTKYFPDGVVAPNDPIFYPHHANVDQVFWKWQQQSGKQWLYNGNRVLGVPVDDALATDILPFYGLGPDIPVSLTLKTENWPMCYTY